ncbi:hypothetical protein [Microbacterium sp. SLBN-154]|uniref:hypothetical protein n=1 Tax=Microbacterium sp. SLBN-154 TaxID=2768458 RepID=UPI001151C583|nr:hypothetical protein [Microbacterium sp. SLBN-154]
MYGRDGVDDFYEPFFNWPTLYRLGGSDDLLEAAKHHWRGVTAQLTEFGFLHEEYEVGYDWFHQAESATLFYGICAADPTDSEFEARARRFANLYLPDSPTGNYDPNLRMIVAPHTGSRGPRTGLGDDWDQYSASQTGMRVFGLPLRDVAGISEWRDLEDPAAARRMGAAMQERLGRGDTAINLAATSLGTNAWLYNHEDRYAEWVLDYVDAWRERTDANGGLVPDNVGPGGRVGELHGGAWYGGLYGWTWPHGLQSLAPATLVAGLNATIISGSSGRLDFVRSTLDSVMRFATDSAPPAASGEPLGARWAKREGSGDAEQDHLLVPYRCGPEGWFDYHPVPLLPFVWLWWITGDEQDWQRLQSIRARSSFNWSKLNSFHDKEEQGHEAPWVEYLAGRNPNYPEHALDFAIRQVLRRVALMEESPDEPDDGDIHFWQRLNPVVTEVLTQLTTGALPAVYYGGLTHARVVFGSPSRPGLPDGVAALVTPGKGDVVAVHLVNLAETAREVLLVAGSFGEDIITDVAYEVSTGYPGDPHTHTLPVPSRLTRRFAVGTNSFISVLSARSELRMELNVKRRVGNPSHLRFQTVDWSPHVV